MATMLEEEDFLVDERLFLESIGRKSDSKDGRVFVCGEVTACRFYECVDYRFE